MLRRWLEAKNKIGFMRILIAPNSMKGSLNAFDFADIVEKAFVDCSAKFELRKVPVADGGDYTGEVLSKSLNAKRVELYVIGPLGEITQAKYAVAGKKAIIEMADASGMKLVNSKDLNPMLASSYGTGQLVADAIKSGCEEIMLAIGGSATVDGGMGMMEALGFLFFDKNGNVLKGNGENLAKIESVQRKEFPGKLKISIVCDVDNPLLGNNGAATVFGPQKGATPKMVEELEKGLANWSAVIAKLTGKNLAKVEGAGAAGGIALPLLAFLNAQMVSGADFVLDQLDLDANINWADLVITGEGKIDSQTLNNKAPFAVAKAAKKKSKPVIAIGGMVEVDASSAFDGIYSLVNGPISLEEAMLNSKELLYNFSSQLARTLHSVTTGGK